MSDVQTTKSLMAWWSKVCQGQERFGYDPESNGLEISGFELGLCTPFA